MAAPAAQRLGSSQYTSVNESDEHEIDCDWQGNSQAPVVEKAEEASLRYLLALTCGVGG